MKTIICGSAISCALLLAACGGGEDTPSTQAAQSDAAQSAATNPPETAAAPAAAESASPAASQAQEPAAPAQAAFADLSSQLTASTAAGTDGTLKELAGQLGTQVQKFGESLSAGDSTTAQLSSVATALLNGEDVDAIATLNDLSGSNLTPGQQSLLKETYNLAAAFVTERNFSALDGYQEEVDVIVSSVREGNYREALPPLQKVWSEARLSDDQKNLLSGVFDQYAPGWRDAADTINKGLDAASGLGL